MTDYTPIDCSLHSEYELAIIQGKHLRITPIASAIPERSTTC